MSDPRVLIGRFVCVALVAGVLQTAGGLGQLQAQETEPAFLMMSDPAFNVPQGMVELPAGAIRLWRETLARPEPDLVKAAADSIALAHTDGFPGLGDCVPDLLAALEKTDLHPAAAYAVCRALIVLEARDAAELLFSASQRQGTDFRQLIEPVLAEWDFRPIREQWRSRFADPEAQRRELLFACGGAGRVKDASAVPLLLEIVRSRTRAGDVRLAAAHAAGAILASGLEPDAERLTGAASPSLIDDLCALSLIGNHTSAAAVERFVVFAGHANPVVVAPALRALLGIDASLVLPLAEEALGSADPKVRECGLDAYIALPTVERISRMADVMDDPHPDVRTSARRALYRFSQVEIFADPVRDTAMRVLSRDSWRGQEQAALLLAACAYQPVAVRLVELLESERPEVMVASAWALRMLAVPDTKDAVLDRARRVTEHVLATRVADRWPGSDPQLGHLFEASAVLGDARALPVMRLHIPKDVHREMSRSAAIWALGRLLEDQPDDALAAALFARITDIEDIPVELDLVRRMSAVTIGRMNAVSHRPMLEYFLDRYIGPSQVDHALAWAIQRMNGNLPPELPPQTLVRWGWAIEPASTQADP